MDNPASPPAKEPAQDRYGRSAAGLSYPKAPTWCPGCGNYAIWGAVKKGLVDCGAPPHEIAVVYDVGCSGNMSDFNIYYAMHALHGRALPEATGLKLANHKLKVVVIGGDGGIYGEGGGHLLNEMRGNHDITLVVHDNHRYSLTTGQYSPTTVKGDKTKSAPAGSIEEPLNPISLALSNHATFVAREFAADIPRVAARITEAINHTGFSLVEILQPCPVFNPAQGYEWYRERLIKLEDMNHDPTNLEAAWNKSRESEKLPIGLYYRTEKPAYHQQIPMLQEKSLVEQFRGMTDIAPLVAEFK
jgi:2-oxoglutarate ferredoxin oxidoreductase subunit beta